MEDKLKLLAKTVRVLSAEGVEQAKSGHPGLPLGAADFASSVWAKNLRFNPKDPTWMNRDRFVLSAGHGSMLLYSLLHLFGYDLPIAELKKFRQWDSKTPGHPEFGWTVGVECTTGPLGQGAANSVGLALSAKLLAERYGKDLFNYRVFALVSDGDMMEGVASEAASLAGHLALDNLVYLYDDNKISLAGKTELCFTELVAKRYESYGWYAQTVDGHDLAAIEQAVQAATKAGKPSIICMKTTIGFGSPNKAGTFKVHGEPLGKEELEKTKAALGWTEKEPFTIPSEVAAYCASLIEEKGQEYTAWQNTYAAWRKSNADLAKTLDAQMSRELPPALKEDLIATFKEGTKDATRNQSGKAIQVVAKHLPNLIGGSADLDPSTKTIIKDGGEIQAGAFKGRNLHFGVREHAMGAAVNGLAYCGCWFPYSATFLVFSDYMRPTLRLAALSHIQSLFIFTHDSFYVGEDGPTHEPIEQIASMRLIPGLYTFRPADGLETALSYYAALKMKNHPSTLVFTRQSLPPLERENSFTPDDILKGGYVVSGSHQSDLVLVATGSEVWIAVEAAKALAAEGLAARVVSIPCVELFREQDESYRNSIIPPKAKKVSIEAGVTIGWERIVGSDGLLIGLDHFGASAPGELLAEKFGFTPEAVKARVLAWAR